MGSQCKQMMDFMCSGYTMQLRKCITVAFHAPKGLSLYNYYIVFVEFREKEKGLYYYHYP